MTRSFRIGRLFGIDIDIDYTWFIVFLIVVVMLSLDGSALHLPRVPAPVRWLAGILTAVLFFGSVLLHELSHSVVALRSGLKISGITLFIFGGVSKMADEPKSPGVEFRMAIAGPLMSVALCGIFLGLRYVLAGAGTPGAALATMFGWLGLMNGVLAVFNLLPGFPLDGGRVLRAGIWKATGNLLTSTRIASSFGQALGFVLIIWGVMRFLTGGPAGLGGVWIALIGWFLVQAAQQSYQQLLLRQQLLNVPVSSAMTEQVEAVSVDATLDQVVHDHVMRHNHRAFPVLDGDRLAGIISLSEIRHIPHERWPWTTVREVIPSLTEAQTIRPDADAWDALIKLTSESSGRLLVTDSGTLRGIITRTDIMRLLRRRMELGM